MKEHIIGQVPLTIDKQFGMVALCQRVFGNTIVGQFIMIITNTYFARIIHVKSD